AGARAKPRSRRAPASRTRRASEAERRLRRASGQERARRAWRSWRFLRTRPRKSRSRATPGEGRASRRAGIAVLPEQPLEARGVEVDEDALLARDERAAGRAAARLR